MSSVPLPKTREAHVIATGEYLPVVAPASTLLQQVPLTGPNFIILMLRGTSYIPSESMGGLDVTESPHLTARHRSQETPRSETAIPGSVIQI